MRNRGGINNILSTDRKALYIVLSIVMVSVLTLTVVYAALSTTLNINGNAEVTAASWDIYLDNVQLNSNSATSDIPTITDKTTATFSTTLTKPGDFYEFTIDVVNNGTIDAMIDSVTKTPTLSETQAKYLNYEVKYQNEETITSKQLVSKNSYVKLLVKVEFRKDISALDLPTASETLDLAFTVNYTQADETGTNVTDNGVKKSLDIISGDLETIGSEVAIGDEHFYIISNTDGEIAMIAKYNLYVGGKYESSWTAYGEEATGIQDSTMLGWGDFETPYNGITAFSSSSYWTNNVSSYPAYVYDSNSVIYNYVENYKLYLESHGVEIKEARLIKIKELESLGCNRSSGSCAEAQSWIYSTSYWTGEASGKSSLFRVGSTGLLLSSQYSSNGYYGVRPVIILNS